MALLSIWETNPALVNDFNIQQIVSSAGDGKLKDGSVCSDEFRDFLSKTSSKKISQYISECLNDSFDKGGFALQDLVNEIGRRLDFDVENGVYQGRVNGIGYDGIWKAPNDQSIIVETKTSDSYRMSLETYAQYRRKLIDAERLEDDATILLVVGRQDTGDLEAQVRGSKYAWDVRIVSAESLVRLMLLKENADDDDTLAKIRGLLRPVEYTRLDNLIDVIFTTVSDQDDTIDTDEGGGKTNKKNETSESGWKFTERAIIDDVRENLTDAIGKQRRTNFIKKTRAQFWSPDRTERIATTISKIYESGKLVTYWYAYHPSWDRFLENDPNAVLGLGCVGLDFGFSIPRKALGKVLPFLNQSTGRDEPYWHLHVRKSGEKYMLLLPKTNEDFDLTEYIVEYKTAKENA